MTETVRRVRQDSLGIYRRDAPFERQFVEPGVDTAVLIQEIGRDPSVIKVIHEVPPPHALGLVPRAVWVRQDDHLVERAYETGRLQIEFDAVRLGNVCGSHAVRRLRVFGSAINDYFDPYSSDVDLIVEFRPGHEPDFFGLMDLEDDLSEQVFDGRPVNVLTVESARRSRLQSGELDDALVLYEESG